MLTHTTIKKTDQQGVVSLMVTMIMMIVISLIVIGFAQVARRNEREALDRQLGTQAFYAAESGINAATKYITDHASTASTIQDTLTQPDCTGFMTSAGLSGTVGPNASASYQCLMIDPTPPRLQSAPLNEDTATVWHIQNDSKFTQLTFAWKNNAQSAFSGANDTCNNTGFPAYTNWKCSYGIVRVDLFDAAGGISSGTINDQNNLLTLYLVPNKTTAGVSSATIANAPQAAQVIQTRCNSTKCEVTLNIPDTSGRQSTEYYARLNMMYQPASDAQLQATVQGGISGAANFINGQAIIDVTGKAQDVRRRVQVVVPLVRLSAELPNYGLVSTDAICKQWTVGPGIPTTTSCP